MFLGQPSASTYRPRERGATMLLTVTLIIIVAALVVSGTGELRALDQIGRAEFAAEAQAYSVAYAGIVDAFAWFRRQTVQPVSTFAPRLDLDEEPPINETEDPARGLMRTFEISPAVWGRYTVLPGQEGESFVDSDGDGIYDLGENFVDTDGDGRRTPATGTRDVTAERGVTGNGTIWRIECLGRVYRWPDLNQPLGEGPNHILGTALLATEIQRLPISPPVPAAAYASRGDAVVVRKRARVRAPITAIAYRANTGSPVLAPDVVIEGGVSAAPVAGDTLREIFGANLTDLQSMADISTTDETTLPDSLPPYSLVVVDGDLKFDDSESLRGSGVLIVTGDLVIEEGSHSYYSGFVYVGGDFALSAPSFIRGQIVARGEFLLEGGIGDVVELEHDVGLIERLLGKMGHYRYSRGVFRPLPHHIDGSPDRDFENRSGRGSKKPKKPK